jgi:hypothetical protein
MLVMMASDRRTYPLPSSLALREKMIAKENMIAEENIVAEVGIDAEIRIIVVGVEVVCVQVYVECSRSVGLVSSRSGWSGSS